MKIITTTRVRNESKNIERFCKAYWWVDKILIADGGSEDNTLLLANQFPNVKTENFKVKIYGENNLWRNPHGRHMNFLFTWAKREGADIFFRRASTTIKSLPEPCILVNFISPDFLLVIRVYSWFNYSEL